MALWSMGCREPEAGTVDLPLSKRYDRLEAGGYLGSLREEVRLEDASAFTEGPAVDSSGRVYFTNIPASQLLRWDPVLRSLEVVLADARQANGLRLDRQGRLLMCEGASGRLTRLDPATGIVTVVADQFEGRPLEPLNDCEIDRQERVYFTARPSGDSPSRGSVKAVYRVDPDGAVAQLLREPDVHMPNGIALSPDERMLYLIDADSGEGRNRHLRVFDVLPDGSLAGGRVLVDFYPGRSGDGMAVDAEGNLYVAAGLHRTRGTSETLDTRPGIHVFSPEGALLDFAETPDDTVTNCTFGGPDLRTLYVTCGPLLLSTTTRLPGKASYRPLG